nr:aspartate/glutamate racemase family protein [Anoxybacillus tepidamans]
MGPLASAEFVQSVYEANIPLTKEQSAPRLVLVSDPILEDRTSIIQQGNDNIFIKSLVDKFEMTNHIANFYVLTCVTAHYFFDKLPSKYQKITINLLEVALDSIKLTKEPVLLLSTKGTYDTHLFNHPMIVYPTIKHQEQIHSYIYNLKQVGSNTEIMEEFFEFIQEISKQYPIGGWLCGCTELHMLSKYIFKYYAKLNLNIIDPLWVIAKYWCDYENKYSIEKTERMA